MRILFWRRRESSVKFKGQLDGVLIRGDRPVKRRKNLGASWRERLRGK